MIMILLITSLGTAINFYEKTLSSPLMMAALSVFGFSIIAYVLEYLGLYNLASKTLDVLTNSKIVLVLVSLVLFSILMSFLFTFWLSLLLDIIYLIGLLLVIKVIEKPKFQTPSEV